MIHRLFIIVCLCFLCVGTFAQRTEKVRAEYIYHAPENISLEEAKRIAYNSNMAKKAAKKAIKDDLEKKGDELHNKLDELLGW